MKRLVLVLVFLCGLCSPLAHAEPYLAVRMGLRCAFCHENPTGGGLRTAFGNAFAQSQLPERTVDLGDAGPWTGVLNRFVSLGADLRAGATLTKVPGETTRDEFAMQETRAYLQLNAIPDRLSITVDERLAPGVASNLEAYGRLWFGGRRGYVKVGQMYLPYGLRLEDDTAFVRSVPAINMNTPDNAVELGWESATWSTQLALGNGTAGAGDTDRGKQWSLRTENVHGAWRLGASANFNDSAAGDRRLLGVHGGLRTGPIAWLGEIDRVSDAGFAGGTRTLWTGLLEANWQFRKGHNLKATVEGFDPDADIEEDEQARYSLFWEWTPLPFVQLRIGARAWEGIPQNALQNRRVVIAELHAFF